MVESYWAVNFVFSAILLLFLEIWWSLECHIFLTKWGFQKLFSHSSSSLSTLSKLLTCCGISWDLYFAVNLMTSFSRQKTVKIKNPKAHDCWENKVLLSCKVSAQTVKNWKTSLKQITFWWQLTRRDAVSIFKRLALVKRRSIMFSASEQMLLSALASTWLFELSNKFIN